MRDHDRRLLFKLQVILCGRGGQPRFASNVSVAVIFLLALLPPSLSRAQLSYTLGAQAVYQYDSNVFDLQRGFVVPGSNDFQRADSYLSYTGNASLNYQASRQTWYVTLRDAEYRYEHFTSLSHNEYNLDGGWNWKLGSAWDGTLDVLRSHTMVAFNEVAQTALAVQTAQRESASARVLFASDWRLEAKGYTQQADEPLQGAPDLQLQENDLGAALTYLGRAGLNSGISIDYLHGDYSGTAGVINPSYRQLTENLVAQYRATGRTTFDAALGYSSRTSSDGLNSVSGFTGSLKYSEQITAKTLASLNISRQINSYLATAGSEIDSIAEADLAWQATYKSRLSVGYNYTYRDLPDQGAIAGTNRIDHQQYASARIDYRPRPWLGINPYANVQTRRSTLYGGNYNATVYGIELLVQLQKNPAQAQ